MSDTDYWVSIGSPDDEYVYVSWDLSKISSWTHKNIRSIEFQLWDANPGNYVIDSVIIHDKNENLLSLNYNGRHKGIANLQFETHWSQSTGNASPYDLSADGLNYQTQLNTNGTFTIGYARTGDYTSGDRAFSWFDGDIAEILWFDEQLSIKNIALVEGYLAHKYGIQDDLIHKDGVGDHPYKYQSPPAIGANNEVY
ncbi:MAG TPA: hypothetical protein EYQ84_08015 [Nitrospinaceae bacterium]|nr:hypothetical protein [Nitrospinaceae bacterium]